MAAPECIAAFAALALLCAACSCAHSDQQRECVYNGQHYIAHVGAPRTETDWQHEVLCRALQMKTRRYHAEGDYILECRPVKYIKDAGLEKSPYTFRVAKAHDKKSVVAHGAQTHGAADALLFATAAGYVDGADGACYVQDYKEFADRGLHLLRDYQRVFGLKAEEYAVLRKHMALWQIVRRCCGARSVIDQRHTLLKQSAQHGERRASKPRHGRLESVASDCHLYNLSAVEREYNGDELSVEGRKLHAQHKFFNGRELSEAHFFRQLEQGFIELGKRRTRGRAQHSTATNDYSDCESSESDYSYCESSESDDAHDEFPGAGVDLCSTESDDEFTLEGYSSPPQVEQLQEEQVAGGEREVKVPAPFRSSSAPPKAVFDDAAAPAASRKRRERSETRFLSPDDESIFISAEKAADAHAQAAARSKKARGAEGSGFMLQDTFLRPPLSPPVIAFTPHDTALSSALQNECTVFNRHRRDGSLLKFILDSESGMVHPLAEAAIVRELLKLEFVAGGFDADGEAAQNRGGLLSTAANNGLLFSYSKQIHFHFARSLNYAPNFEWPSALQRLKDRFDKDSISRGGGGFNCAYVRKLSSGRYTCNSLLTLLSQSARGSYMYTFCLGAKRMIFVRSRTSPYGSANSSFVMHPRSVLITTADVDQEYVFSVSPSLVEINEPTWFVTFMLLTPSFKA